MAGFGGSSSPCKLAAPLPYPRLCFRTLAPAGAGTLVFSILLPMNSAVALSQYLVTCHSEVLVFAIELLTKTSRLSLE